MNSNDSGAGSMREAFALSCAGDTIHFQSSVNDTILLDSDIIVSHNAVVLGTTTQNIVISGQNSTRMFVVQPSIAFTLNHVTLHGGNELINGGAILNDGNLILENTSFVRNRQGNNPKAWTNRSQVLIKQGTTFVRIE
jgi:hypothetical protein